jgi:hypothetical protein
MSIRQQPIIGDRVSVVDMFRRTIVFVGTLTEIDNEIAIVSNGIEEFPALPEEIRKERRQ